ncbi:MAG TPA: PIG-L family deacetylase [Micromonosporaceae bacterium]|nr:PIG-L family deacetylase [Micromonosporaceae bacterium]
MLALPSYGGEPQAVALVRTGTPDNQPERQGRAANGRPVVEPAQHVGSPPPWGETRPLCALFSGAHPDDVELGAGGLVQRMVQRGHVVWFLILTDEPGCADTRRAEAVRSAGRLGVPGSQVIFAGFTDGHLRADRESVALVRRLAAAARITADVVVTHTAADSHNDHGQANALLRAAFRRGTMLFYPIHTSAEPSHISPRLFVSLAGRVGEVKSAALAEHRSQLWRINRGHRGAFEAQLGHIAGLDRAEAFEIALQVGAGDVLAELTALNDSAFHSFWLPLIRHEPLFLLYDAYLGQPRSVERYSRHHESAGRDTLREAFADHWFPRSPLRERPATQDNEPIAAMEHLLLVGGPVSNPVARRLLNRDPAVDWVVEYGGGSVHLRRRSTGVRVHPRHDRHGLLVEDVGVLTVVRPALSPGKSLVACAGVHGVGTQGLLRFLAQPQSNRTLADQAASGARTQVPVRIDASSLELRPLADAHQMASPGRAEQDTGRKGAGSGARPR